ncbi:two-component system response regulator [Pseudofrankia sp. EUN1h]|nr:MULTISPECIES: response regulator [Pseudofrankia]OHV29805.1 two-component system response regulator [Pseudofrankia sp. EUN1h]
MAGEPIRTLVVEDDPLLAEAHRTFVRRLPGFAVADVADCGTAALRFVAQHPVDLVLLDFYLPDMNGLAVCRSLRAHGAAVDVIAVTSARDLDVVRTALAYGVVQYLLKPFSFATFRDRLERYADYRRQMSGAGPSVDQRDLDRAFAALREPAAAQAPKGLSADTLAAVVRHLRTDGGNLTAADVAAAVEVSRVTARRYLEHLASQHLADRAQRHGGTGRPEFLYRWSGN